MVIKEEKLSDEIVEPFTESDIQNLSEDVVNSLEANKASKNYMEYRKYSE